MSQDIGGVTNAYITQLETQGFYGGPHKHIPQAL